MQKPKSNFIDETRNKLQILYIQKIQKHDEMHQNTQFFKTQSKAKDIRMEYQNSQILSENQEETNGIDNLTGWASTRNEGENYGLSQRRSSCLRKNIKYCGGSILRQHSERRDKNVRVSTELKNLLKRLQSPKQHRRGQTTQGSRMGNKKCQQTFYPKLSMAFNKAEQIGKHEKLLKMDKDMQLQSKQLIKYKTIDLNSENVAFTSQSGRATSQYKKIRRKATSCQNEIDIVHQKNILQQLIKGTPGNKNILCLNRNFTNIPKYNFHLIS